MNANRLRDDREDHRNTDHHTHARVLGRRAIVHPAHHAHDQRPPM